MLLPFFDNFKTLIFALKMYYGKFIIVNRKI